MSFADSSSSACLALLICPQVHCAAKTGHSQVFLHTIAAHLHDASVQFALRSDAWNRFALPVLHFTAQFLR